MKKSYATLANIKQATLVSAIIAISIVLFLKDLKLQSATYDEEYYYLKNVDYLIKNFSWDQPYINFHPPLMYYLHGLPLLFTNPSDPAKTLFLERISILPLYIFFAILLFILAKRNFGQNAGFMALILYSFNIEILAHSRLVTADYLMAISTFGAVASFSYFIKKQNLIWMTISGISLGLALTSKYTALMLIPIYIIVLLLPPFKDKILKTTPAKILGLFLIAILIVHASYLFKGTGTIPDNFNTTIMNRIYNNSTLKYFLNILPASYLAGMDYQMAASQSNRPAFLLGKPNQSDIWFFYVVSLILKIQIPLLILTLWYIHFTFRKKELKTIEITALLTIIFFFLYLSFFSKLNQGLRYLLFIFPLLSFLTSKLALYYDFEKNRKSAAVIIILLLLYIFEAIKISPHFLSYANQFIGGSKNAYKYFADSNIDWGQNYILFYKYYEQHDEIVAINPRKPTVGKIAVGVNDINLTYYYHYDWLRKINKEPIDQVGYTWLIFEIKPEDIKQH